MTTKIKSNMTTQPVSISADMPIADAQEIMRSWGMRHLPVVEDERLVGVLSERDILKALALSKPGKTEAKEVMSTSPYQVRQDVSVAVAARAMAEAKMGCTIVTDGQNRVVGIFTTTDALNLLSRLLHEPGEVDYHVLKLADFLTWQRAV